ncbi:MAG: PASTA domain-containing protein, partial [Clostridia bacterium]|nr:PASTA domain-containing protein [Clostridia bacterium]
SPAIEEVLAKAMCKDLSQRYQSAEQMFVDLRRALRQPAGGFVKMRPDPVQMGTQRTRPGIVRRVRRRWRGRLLFLLTALLCVGVIGVIVGVGYNLWIQLTDYTTIPDVRGYEETLALNALRRASLDAAIVREYSDGVHAGFVIAQEPPEGVMLKRGERVLLYVSLGSGRVRIPDVVGLIQEFAEEELASLGLVMGDVLVELSEAPLGQVIRQEPPPGAEAEGGELVDLVVSGGLVVMPDLSNQPFAVAAETLESLGLQAGDISYVDVDTARQDSLVQAQDPKVGEAVFPGAVVQLSVGRFDARPFRKSVTFQASVPQGGARIRVTLVEPDGQESEQYAAKHTLAGVNVITVELRSAIGRDMLYRVYVDDVLADERPVSFE